LQRLGADAVLELGDPDDDLAERIKDAAGGEVDVTIDMLWGPLAIAAMNAAARFARHVEVGNMAAPEITLPAPLIRSKSLDVRGEGMEAVGPGLEVPEGTFAIDAAGGIVMPGMIDTHRHMWQTAMRGYGADWTLSQYFVFYYLEHGRIFRPQDVYAGNLLSAIESLDAGVTTTVDWSHGLQTVDHADAAVDALQAVPGRFVLAYGNIQQGP